MKKLVEIVCVCVVNFVSIFFTILIKGNGVIWITSIEYFFFSLLLVSITITKRENIKKRAKLKITNIYYFLDVHNWHFKGFS